MSHFEEQLHRERYHDVVFNVMHPMPLWKEVEVRKAASILKLNKGVVLRLKEATGYIVSLRIHADSHSERRDIDATEHERGPVPIWPGPEKGCSVIRDARSFWGW